MTSNTSLFTKIRATALALGRSERTATRKARLLAERVLLRFRSADARTKRQARPLAESSPLRPQRRTHNESDADHQRAPVRDQAGQRAVRPHAGEGDGSAAARRRLVCFRRPARARRQSRDHPRGNKVIAEIKKLRASGEARSEQFARQAAARNLASSL